MGRDHHGLLRQESEHPDRGVVDLGARFVLTGHFGTQRRIPWQPGVTRHVDDQRDVSVRERGQQEPLAESAHALGCVGPAVQPVPHPIEVVAFLLVQTGESEAGQQAVENLPVQDV